MIRTGVKPIIFLLNNSGYTIERFIHGKYRSGPVFISVHIDLTLRVPGNTMIFQTGIGVICSRYLATPKDKCRKRIRRETKRNCRTFWKTKRLGERTVFSLWRS